MVSISLVTLGKGEKFCTAADKPMAKSLTSDRGRGRGSVRLSPWRNRQGVLADQETVRAYYRRAPPWELSGAARLAQTPAYRCLRMPNPLRADGLASRRVAMACCPYSCVVCFTSVWRKARTTFVSVALLTGTVEAFQTGGVRRQEVRCGPVRESDR